jgi:hypothetical protein
VQFELIPDGFRGTELSKLELTKLPTFRARRIEAPLLEGCVGWIECGVHDAYHKWIGIRSRIEELERDRVRTGPEYGYSINFTPASLLNPAFTASATV